MINSNLNINISCFEKCTSTIPKDINLLSWLTSEKYRNNVEQLRNIQDEALQKIIKASLPAITPSGIFSHRSEKGLIEHSGFLAFDIDFNDNQHISNFDRLKEQLSHIPNIAYCGLSVGGKGFWGLVPIPESTPEVHKQRFSALVKDFKEFGIVLDLSGSDICRLRIYSWDQESYFNHSARLYTKLLIPQQKTYIRPRFSNTRVRVEAIISQIKAHRIDLTEDYKEGWLKIASALANEFGESGRDYFHTLSQFHPKYSVVNTDRMFDSCLKHNYHKVTIGSFFHIAESHGIKPKPEPILSHTGVQQSFQTSSRLQVSQSEGLSLKYSTVASETIPAKEKITTNKIWDHQIEELERFFKVIDLLVAPIKISNYCTITDVSLFIERHFSIVRAQNGNKTYEPYLERLNDLRKLLLRN